MQADSEFDKGTSLICLVFPGVLVALTKWFVILLVLTPLFRTGLQRKYPDATDYAICSLIGGFFFLRFINPAIVTPQAYMLVDGVPAKFPRRTLTLVGNIYP